jgi:hypothetical protein
MSPPKEKRAAEPKLRKEETESTTPTTQPIMELTNEQKNKVKCVLEVCNDLNFEAAVNALRSAKWKPEVAVDELFKVGI